MYSISAASNGFLRYRFGNCQSSIVGKLIAWKIKTKSTGEIWRLVLDLLEQKSLRLFNDIPQLVMMTMVLLMHHLPMIHSQQQQPPIHADVEIWSMESVYQPIVESMKPKPFLLFVLEITGVKRGWQQRFFLKINNSRRKKAVSSHWARCLYNFTCGNSSEQQSYFPKKSLCASLHKYRRCMTYDKLFDISWIALNIRDCSATNFLMHWISI